MMKKIKLGMTIFWQQKFFNFLICLELALMFVLLAVSFNRLDFANKNEKILLDSKMQNALNVASSGGRYAEQAGQDLLGELNKILETKSFVEGVSYVEHPMMEDSDFSTSFLIYDSLTAKRLKMPLLAGQWLPEKSDDGTIPVVAYSDEGKDYQIGQKIEVTNNGKKLVLKVVGKTNSVLASLFYPSGGRVGLAESEKLFADTLHGMTILITSADFLRGDSGGTIPNFMIYMKESASLEEIRALQQELSELGQVDLVSDMIAKSKEVHKERIRKDSSNTVVLAIASIIGVLSVSILNINKQMRRFSIWAMHGYTESQIGLTYSIYTVLLGLGSLLIFAGLMQLGYWISDRRAYIYLIKWEHMIWMILIAVITTLVTTIIALKAIKKHGLFKFYYE